MVPQRHVLLILDPCWFVGFDMYVNIFCCYFCSCDGAKNFYLLLFMLSVILVFSQERIFNFLKCIPGPREKNI